MRKLPYFFLALASLASADALACSNVIVSKGASADGSCMISYAADSHWLYGELYCSPARRYRKGTFLDIREWDTNKPLGRIAQAERTWRTTGNMNEWQVIIGETTWGGREEQMDTTGIMDYGSLIYITLQRAKSAREAIETIVSLADEYGYPSEGETFSIADTEEAWIMDLVGKGSPSADAPVGSHPGIAWVARRIPDGYVCAHANQARIRQFPQNDPENCLYDKGMIEYARACGWFEGADEEFSFREAFCPLDFGTVRGCDARVWSAFNILGKGVFSYEENGKEISRPSSDWLNYAMGYDLSGDLPLFVKPSGKVTPKAVADVMRDHFEGTPMDMTTDIGAGGNACPYRWRPMDFEWEGKTYTNERAIATQQTGFWFVAQARGYLPREAGALVWFGCDDAATSYLTPVYVCTGRIPECLRVGNGNLLEYSPTSQFWMCNRVTNACYRMYDRMAPVVRAAADAFENSRMSEEVPKVDARVAKILNGKGLFRKLRARWILTRYTVSTAEKQLKAWKSLEELLLVKFIDGNVKAQNEDGSFKHSEWSEGIPDGLVQPGYTDVWKAAVARDPHACVLEEK